MEKEVKTKYSHTWVNEWAKYYAVDNGGFIFEFEEHPNRSLELWYSEEGKSAYIGRSIELVEEDDWKYLYGEREKLRTDELENLLLNMFGGLLPEHLSKEEQEMLKNAYGENWFERLGYAEPEYKKPLTF